MLSIVLHATVLIACGLLAPAAAEPVGEPERSVGIALVSRPAGEGDGEQHATAAPAAAARGSSTAPGSEATDNRLPNQLPTLDALGGEYAASLPKPESATAGVGSGIGLPDATGFVGSTQRGSGPGRGVGQTRTQVFGATGEGSKFVYVFDRSASMGGFEGRPLAAAKRELIKSLADLQDLHQFQILFYNERPSVFNPAAPAPPTILFATSENRELASRFVAGVTAHGGTRHLEALEAALRMGPDVIFFLTDANEPVLSPTEIAALGRRNRSGAAIHCIEFGVGPFSGDDNFLVRLARQNRGQHVYVDVTQLGRTP